MVKMEGGSRARRQTFDRRPGKRPPVESELLRLCLGETFEDERVGLVGELGDQREVVATEAVGIVVVLRVVPVGAGEGDDVERLAIGFVRPHGGLDATEAESLDRKFGAGRCGLGGGGGVGFRGHGISCFSRSGIALSPKGGGAGRTEVEGGGIPSKEDPNEDRSRSDRSGEGTARESKHAPGKKEPGPRRLRFSAHRGIWLYPIDSYGSMGVMRVGIHAVT